MKAAEASNQRRDSADMDVQRLAKDSPPMDQYPKSPFDGDPKLRQIKVVGVLGNFYPGARKRNGHVLLLDEGVVANQRVAGKKNLRHECIVVKLGGKIGLDPGGIVRHPPGLRNIQPPELGPMVTDRKHNETVLILARAMEVGLALVLLSAPLERRAHGPNQHPIDSPDDFVETGTALGAKSIGDFLLLGMIPPSRSSRRW